MTGSINLPNSVEAPVKGATEPPRTVMVLGAFGPSMALFRLPLLEQLKARGCRVIAAIPLAELSPGERARIERTGATLVDAPVSRHSVGIGDSMAYAAHIRRLVKTHRVDALVPYTIKPVIFGTLGARAGGARKVVPMVTGLGSTLTGAATSPRARAVRMVVTRLYRTALAAAGVAVFQNPDDPRDLAAFGGLDQRRTRVRLMPGSGVDVRHFAAQPLQPRDGGLVVLMIARVLADKGVREFAHAARLVRARHPTTRFQLVGPFDQNPTAITPAEVTSWSDVEYLGATEDVRPMLGACHIYVLPSYREGTPRSVLEAMATGRPVVTTDAPGCRETVSDGVNGFLVPVADAAALAAAISRFVERPDLIATMAAAGRRLAETKYNADHAYDGVLAELGFPPSA